MFDLIDSIDLMDLIDSLNLMLVKEKIATW